MKSEHDQTSVAGVVSGNVEFARITIDQNFGALERCMGSGWRWGLSATVALDVNPQLKLLRAGHIEANQLIVNTTLQGKRQT